MSRKVPLVVVILIFLFTGSQAQAPYTNITCDAAIQLCNGQPYTYTAWTDNNYAQTGPYYGCLGSQPDPAWFYFQAETAGNIIIGMSSTPCQDIDYICWGPYDSLEAGCNGGLTQANVISCSYSSICIETCTLPSVISGKFYILLITNFSKQACTVTFSQTGGSGTMSCIMIPIAGNSGPVCQGESLQLTANTFSGASYQWSGPNGFTSTLQNPLISNAMPPNSGTYTLTVTLGGNQLAPVSTTATINPLPVAEVTPNSGICTGEQVSIGGLSVAGNTYAWSSNPSGFSSTSSDPVVSPTVSTTYTLTVTSSAGCSAFASTTVTVHPLPTAVILASSSICSGSQVNLGGTPTSGCTYSWSSEPPGFTSTQPNPAAAPLISTIYTLTVTSSYNCTITYSVSVTVNQSPDAITGPDTAICQGVQVSLGAAPVSGNTYQWTSNPNGFTATSSLITVTPLVTTIYTLVETQTSSNCSGTRTVTVTVNPLPAANAGNSTSLCSGNTATLGGTAVPGNTYSWTSNPPGFVSIQSNPTVTPLQTTSYQLVETTIHGCTMSHSVTITVNPLPAANTGPNTAICVGNALTIGTAAVPGNSYLWSSDPLGFTSNLSNPIVSPSATTTYSLKETIQATGCARINSVVITVNPLPTLIILSNTTVCSGTSVAIGGPGSPGNTYQWTSNPSGFNSNQPNPTVTPLSTITYMLTQTISATGCSKNGSVTITVNLTPSAFTGPNTTICSGNQASLGGYPVSGSIYSWTSNPPGFTSQTSNPTVQPSVTTTYTLVETGISSGCTASHSVVVTVNPTPTVTLNTFSPVCSSAPPFTLTGGSPAGGFFGGQGVSNGQFNPSSVSTGNHFITYFYTNSLGCTGTAGQNILVESRPKIFGLLKYLNVIQSPLDSSKVKLYNSLNQAIDSVTSTNTGAYSFNCLQNGSYKVRASCVKRWGGGNAIDALLVARYAVGLITFTSTQVIVADVNNSGNISATDSYLILRRWAKLSNSFAAGDWYITHNDTITLNNSNFQADLNALCTGDVDGSHLPYVTVKNSTLVQTESYKKRVVFHQQRIQLPVQMSRAIVTNAVGLVLEIPDFLTIENIRTSLAGAVTNVIQGQIRFGWYSLTPLMLNEDDTLLLITATLSGQPIKKGNYQFQASTESVFADFEGVPLNAILKIPRLEISSAPEENQDPVQVSEVYPQPFKGNAEISLKVNQESFVLLSIADVSGKEIVVLQQGSLPQGQYVFQIHGSLFRSGLYFIDCHFVANGTPRHIVRKLVIQ